MFLTDEQLAIQDVAREFADKSLAPLVQRMEAGDIDAIKEAWKTLAETGIIGLTFPEEFGGSDLDTLSYLVALEQVARVSASFAMALSVHVSVGALPIWISGSVEQKAKYLPGLINGERVAAFALTEPDAGSDAANGISRAVHNGNGHYQINGNKIFISNAQIADIFITTARTNPEATRAKGLSAFIVDRETPGFHIEQGESKMGMCGSDWGELRFVDCDVPTANMLGPEGHGFKIFMQSLDAGRVGIGAVSLGLGQACLDASLEYVKQRKQFGKALHEFQAIQFKLADMAMEIEAARHLVYQAARQKDAGSAYSQEASYAKLYASEMCNRAAKEAVQIFGGYGYTKDFPVERFFRDARATEIIEGTSQIQRTVIARHLLAN